MRESIRNLPCTSSVGGCGRLRGGAPVVVSVVMSGCAGVVGVVGAVQISFSLRVRSKVAV